VDFKEKIKTRRIELGLTLEEVGNFVGVSRGTVQRWETGNIENMRQNKIAKLAEVLRTTPSYLMGWNEFTNNWVDKNAIPVENICSIPILGVIRAGTPVFAEENIEGWELANVKNAEDFFFLRVKGDSMVNANITDNSLVLIKKQKCADDGQIVAAIVDGENATLKRYKKQGDLVFLLPENNNYNPVVLHTKDFEEGKAMILGVAKRIVINLI
jgi:repressor LexA